MSRIGLGVRVSKAVLQTVPPVPNLDFLFDNFKQMINFCIHVGIKKGISSRFNLQNEVYHTLRSEYHSTYILTAVEKTSTILKNYRREKRKNPAAKEPYVTRPFISIPYIKVDNGVLRVPVKPHEYIPIALNAHTREVLSDPSLKLGSATLTRTKLSVSYSKEIEEITPSGQIGVDRNLDNVTIASSERFTQIFDLSKATEIKRTYQTVKSHFKRNDVRIQRRVSGKYGQKQRNKVKQILHRVSKEIVTQAKMQKLGLVMENLKGIRKLYRKGNGQGVNYRARLNSWSFAELQRQIEYKAKWEGLPVIYVDAWGTSSKCSTCGSHLYPNEHRTLYCPNCNISIDRDVNAARNILAKGGMRFVPDGRPSEGMVVECRMK